MKVAGRFVPAEVPSQTHMVILVNGRWRTIERAMNISELLELLELRPDRCAVERNGHLVRRSEWSSTPVNNRDEIEIVQFVGGG